MDLTKYPLEKVFYFVAGIIPGFIALLIHQVAVPGAFAWFFTLGFLGYKTKLGVILLVAFVIGNSMTTFLRAIFGLVGGLVGGVIAKRPYTPPQAQVVAPWRDPRWRTVLKKQLGVQIPTDTMLVAGKLFDQKREGIQLLPEPERTAALQTLNLEKLQTEIDDGKWEQWYAHYHRIVLSDPERDFQSYVGDGLAYNVETAAVYVLLSALWVPDVRRWWCLGAALFWVLILFSQEYSAMMRYLEPWATLSEQITYLDRRNRNSPS